MSTRAPCAPTARLVCWGDNGDGQADGSREAASVRCQRAMGTRAPCAPTALSNAGDQTTMARRRPSGGASAPVSAGRWHSCGLRTDDTVECWGADDDGQATAPEGSFSAVSAGNRHSCGLRTDSAVECWGTWTVMAGQRPPREASARCRQAAGTVAGCAPTPPSNAGDRSDDGQATAPGGSFSSVSAGTWHSCGLRTDNTVECWGTGPLWPDDGPRGELQLGKRQGWPQLRTARRRQDRLLGQSRSRQRARPEQSPPRPVHCCVRGRGAHMRLARRRRRCVLGRQQLRPDDSPRRELQLDIGGPFRHSCGLRTDSHRRMLGIGRRRPEQRAPRGELQLGVSRPLDIAAGCAPTTPSVCWGDRRATARRRPPTGASTRYRRAVQA